MQDYKEEIQLLILEYGFLEEAYRNLRVTKKELEGVYRRLEDIRKIQTYLRYLESKEKE